VKDAVRTGKIEKREQLLTYLEMTDGLHEVRSDEFVFIKMGEKTPTTPTPTSTSRDGTTTDGTATDGVGVERGHYMNYEIPGEKTLVGPTHVMDVSGLDERCQICMEELRGELCMPTTGDGLGMEGIMVLPCCGRLMHSRCMSRCCGEELTEDYDGSDGCVNMTRNIMGWGRGEWLVCMMCRGTMFPMTEVGASEGYIRASECG
jgi:hypothetical protein